MTLNIVTWNVRGLHSPIKRQRVLSHLSKLNVNIAMIQETHLSASESLKLKRDWVGEVFFSPGDGKRNGVVTLCHKSLHVKLLSQKADDTGRWLFTDLLVGKTPLSLFNIYAPTSGDSLFWSNIAQQLLQIPNDNLIVAGDCNHVIDPFIDRHSASPHTLSKSHKAFVRSFQQRHLVDAWRLCNPTLREYTFFSPAHHTQSRLDYFLISHSLSQAMLSSEIGSILISDHAPVSLSLDILHKSSTPRRWRFNNSLLLDPNFSSSFLSFSNEFFSLNLSENINFSVIWDSYKAAARDFIISYTSKKRHASRKLATDLFARIKALEHEYYTSKSRDCLSSLIAAKLKFNKESTDNASLFLLKSSAKFYGGNNKAGKLLANYLKVKKNKFHIESILDVHQSPKFKDSDILQEFCYFYQSLYTPETSPSAEAINDYLSSIVRPHASPPDFHSLESDISQTELSTALSSLKKDKAPGPDGFTVEFFLHFSHFLIPKLHTLLSSFSSAGSASGSFLEALICLIPKENKDPRFCKNYRPISLVNIDYKIFSKSLATRLEPLLPLLLGKEQSGFVKGRFLTDNTRLFFSILSKSSHSSASLAAIALDAEKAFDRVYWPFIFSSLRWFGFGPKIISLISLLYSNPTAAIFVNGLTSSYFPLGRGVRQGCPLSPFLFNLALEPFLCRLRQNTDFQGFKFGDSQIKLAAYADDILLFMSNPSSSLPAFLSETLAYSLISGYKLNKDKCEILPLTKFTFKEDFKAANFSWNANHIKYLGIYFSSSLKTSVSINLDQCCLKIATLIEKWHPLYLSWWGRLDTIKMMLSPIILFTISNIPVNIPLSYYKRINSLLTSFLWNKKKPRISLHKLCRPKLEGGVNFPDFPVYHTAFNLRQSAHWLADPSSDSPLWVLLEQSFLAPFSFSEFLSFTQKPQHLSTPIIKYTYKLLDALTPSTSPSLNSFLSSSVWHNHSILIKGKPIYWKSWRQKGLLWVSQLYHQDTILSFSQAQAAFHFPPSFSSKYLLLRSTLLSTLRSLPSEPSSVPAHMVNSIPFLKTNPRASAIYKHLRPSFPGRDKTKIELEWEKDFQTSWPSSTWNNIWLKVGKTSRAANTVQTLFFIYNRSLFSPSLLHKFNNDIPNTCWSCSTPQADLMHMLFTCPFVHSFWEKVWHQILQIFHFSAPLSPVNLFLGSLSDDWQDCPLPLCILDLLLGTAFQQITKNWKTLSDLSFQAWWYSVCFNHRLDTVYVFPVSLAPKRKFLWSPVTDFIDSKAHYSSTRNVSAQEVLKPP